MYPQQDFERCINFINSQTWDPISHPLPQANGKPLLTITISRQSGSGAHLVANCLASYLQEQFPAEGAPWSIFDRNLVEEVLDDHHLPRRIARFMPEDRVPELADAVDE